MASIIGVKISVFDSGVVIVTREDVVFAITLLPQPRGRGIPIGLIGVLHREAFCTAMRTSCGAINGYRYDLH